MSANNKVLDRQAATAFGTSLSREIEVAESIVDYGTHLIVRLMHYSADSSIQHLVPICSLAKQTITMLDGITTLLRSGCGIAIYPLSRSLWEADLQMTWVLETDQELRARTYWVAHLLKELRRCESERQSSEARKKIKQSYPTMQWREESAIASEIANIEAVLDRPEHAAIRTAAKRSGFWAASLGVGSFEAMAQKLDRWPEYEVLYRTLSGVVHSTNPGAHVRKQGVDLRINDIRDPSASLRILTMSCYWTIRGFANLIQHYRPEEQRAFAQRYAREWRSALLPDGEPLPSWIQT